MMFNAPRPLSLRAVLPDEVFVLQLRLRGILASDCSTNIFVTSKANSHARSRSPGEMGGIFDRELDSIYLGGGTPSVLAPDQLAALFRSVRQNFTVLPRC